MLKIQKMISQYNHYDCNNPKFISIHYVGAKGSTAKNNATYFFNGDRQASAHYFVDDNEIWQSVEDLKGSWAIGNTRTEVNNKNSISVEMCCFEANLGVSKKTEQNTVELVAYLMNKYNIPLTNVRTHYEISGKTKICPNWSDNNWSRWSRFLDMIQAELNILNKKEEGDVMDKIVLYYGDADVFAAIVVAQKHMCPVMRLDHFNAKKLKAKTIIQIGGNKNEPTRFDTFKNAAKLV